MERFRVSPDHHLTTKIDQKISKHIKKHQERPTKKTTKDQTTIRKDHQRPDDQKTPNGLFWCLLMFFWCFLMVFDVFLMVFIAWRTVWGTRFEFCKNDPKTSKNIKKDHQRPDDETTKHHKISDLIKKDHIDVFYVCWCSLIFLSFLIDFGGRVVVRWCLFMFFWSKHYYIVTILTLSR